MIFLALPCCSIAAFICPVHRSGDLSLLSGLGRPRASWVGCPAHSGMMAGQGVGSLFLNSHDQTLPQPELALEKEHCPWELCPFVSEQRINVSGRFTGLSLTHHDWTSRTKSDASLEALYKLTQSILHPFT